jgi:hypothetical protein
MSWIVTPDLLTSSEKVGSLRNVGMLLVPNANRPRFGPISSSCVVWFSIDSHGNLNVTTPIPQLRISATGLSVVISADGIKDGIATWNFGDGSGDITGATQTHLYGEPGVYIIKLSIELGGQRYVSDIRLAVSRTLQLVAPLAAFPTLATCGPFGKSQRLIARTTVEPTEKVSVVWQLDSGPPHEGPVTLFELIPSDYKLRFTATRDLKAYFHPIRLAPPAAPVTLRNLSVSTNRSPKSLADNELASQLFAGGKMAEPVDEWVLQLNLSDNACLRSVGRGDKEEFAADEFRDCILTLEYEVETGITLSVVIDNWPADVIGPFARLTPERGPWAEASLVGVISGDGSAEFAGLTRNITYALFIGPTPDGRTAYLPGINPARRSVGLHLSGHQSITGRLLVPAGAGGMSVAIFESGVRLAGVVDSVGGYSIIGVPDGSWIVRAYCELGGNRYAGSIQAQAGQSADISLSLQG